MRITIKTLTGEDCDFCGSDMSDLTVVSSATGKTLYACGRCLDVIRTLGELREMEVHEEVQ